MKISQKKLDDWIFMLEDKGILELKYPVFGEPEIVLKHAPESIQETKKEVIVENRIIPGKPIKMPTFKPGTIADSYHEETENNESVEDELKALEERISKMASQRSESEDTHLAERLKVLESKMRELSERPQAEKQERIDSAIIDKLEKIEQRLDSMHTKKVNKQDSTKDLKKGLRIKGTDDV